MSHDENEQQHIKQTRQSIHLQSQPHKKGSPLAGGDNRCNTRIGVVGVSPTDIPRHRLGYQSCICPNDNLLVTHFTTVHKYRNKALIVRYKNRLINAQSFMPYFRIRGSNMSLGTKPVKDSMMLLSIRSRMESARTYSETRR